MVVNFMLWYLLVLLIGWLAFPFAYRLLPNMPDRGYALARPLGLLLWGYTFWMLASLGILQNDLGGSLLALTVLAGLGIWMAWRSGPGKILAWARGKAKVIIIGEILFLLAFAGWALVRALDPAIVGTEKPMEMAFINSILRSPGFPPNDPWLSGYAISYYYFGYTMVALITRLTATDPGIAFNLAVALWFALTALGAYGVVYALLAIIGKRKQEANADSGAPWFGLLGPFFILIVSNVEGFLEMLHSRGIFWVQAEDGTLQSKFWSWLDLQELIRPPVPPYSWTPERAGGIWWWRASRVLQDYTMARESREIIDEFPFFSYYLADLHPHVLAMPFALLAIGLALNLYLGHLKRSLAVNGLSQDLERDEAPDLPTGKSLLGVLGAWWKNEAVSWQSMMVTAWMRQPFFWLGALVLGGLSFLNTFDFPTYVGLFCLTYGLIRYQQEGWAGRRIGEFVELGLALGITSVILYLPFYTGFASQVGGILPSLSFFTRGVHFWLMFASLLGPILFWLLWLWGKRVTSSLVVLLMPVVLAWLVSLGLGANTALMILALLASAFLGYYRFRSGRVSGEIAGHSNHLKVGFVFAVGIIGGLWLFSYLLGALGANLSGISNAILNSIPPVWLANLANRWNAVGGLFFVLHGSSDPAELIGGSLARRLNEPGTWITLLVVLAFVWGRLASFRPVQEGEPRNPPKKGRLRSEMVASEHSEEKQEPADGFVLLLVLVGAGLTLVPEFIYLRDQFGWRMNTIFKMYFQTWMVWGIAAVYASVVLWKRLGGGIKTVYGIGWLLLLGMAVAYPYYCLRDRLSILGSENPSAVTLDGTAHIDRFNPDEMAGIRWLRQAPYGIVAEAVGGSYSGFARISTNTGLPTVIGWPGHESQWRGGAAEIGSREPDIRKLYETWKWEEALSIIQQYQIRYIYIGSMERSSYRLNQLKFDQVLRPVFQQGEVIIYEVPLEHSSPGSMSR